MNLNSLEKLPLPNPPQPPFWYSSPLSSFSLHPIIWIISRNNVGLNIIADAPAASVHVCASRSPDAAAWVRLSQLLDGTLTNEVDRKASTSQSLALLRVAASVFTEIQSLQDLRRTFLGSMCNAVGLHFVTMRDVILLATRVNLIGPLAYAEKMRQKWRDRDVSEAYCLMRCRTAMLTCSLRCFAPDYEVRFHIFPSLTLYNFFKHTQQRAQIHATCMIHASILF
ncbi:hypothetical protein VPH35_110131 [Triticum aestivum]